MFTEYLLRHSPDIVHFSGHDSDHGHIILEDRTGNAKPVSPQAIGRMFRTLKDNVRCVVLNAWFSATQAQAIVEEIDCVVGMSQAVGDDAAIQFASGFYQALGYGRSVQTAFDVGCSQIDLEVLGEEATPQLLVKPGIDAATLAFVPRQPEATPDSGPPTSSEGIDNVALRLAIVQAFSLEELANLCADIEAALARDGIPLQLNLDVLAGSGLEGKVRELIAYLDRRGRFSYLVSAVRSARPGSI